MTEKNNHKLKTKYIISIIIIGLVVSYFTIGSFAVGYNFLNPIFVMYVPSIVMQLIANEGNGIICLDACGPCSAYGPWHIVADGECVLPSEESCKLMDKPGEWEFEKGTCMPVCKEPYSDFCKQEIIMETIRELVIKDCQPGSESSLPSSNILYANSTHHFDGNTCEWYESD